MHDTGASILDLLLVVLLVGTMAAVVAPVGASVVDGTRVRHAAGFLASRFRLARSEAVSRSANVGVVFDSASAGWTLRVCRDGTGNGLRRAEIQSGADPCFEGPYALGALFPQVEVAVDPGLVGPAGEPGSPDPVRFGTADLLSFSPTGTCTSGSVFLKSAAGVPYVVRVAGTTGRVRLLRHQAGGWIEP
jgi:type II secretory pathway pseudopilin PulG